MFCSLQYGRDGSVDLNPPDGSWLAENETTCAEPLDDLVAATQAALNEPLDFPALNLMVLPDDAVAIALQPALSRAADLLAGTIQSLMTVGVPPELIHVVRSQDDTAVSDKKLLSKIDPAIAARIDVVRHDPAKREELSFLGASKDEHAIYVNRTLCDAAVVIPIGSQQQNGTAGLHDSWFPTFADQETQQRFTKSLASLSAKKLEKRKAESEEVAWMLGVQLVLQLIPAGDGQVRKILAGTPSTVRKQANALAEQIWRMDVDRRASLVVAAIGGGAEQQTWDNVIRAIETALDAVEVDGAIAVCCQLKTKPGPAMRRLAGADSFEAAERLIKKGSTPDTVAAVRLNRALQRARIYLLSELQEGDVEDLGMAYVANEQEIAKLSTQHDSCLVLRNAQHVSISLQAKDEI